MHILIISSKFPFPLKDGGAIATYNLISGLSKHKNDIFLLSFNTKKHHTETKNIKDIVFEKIKYLNVELDTTTRLLDAAINLVFSDLPYILKRFKSTDFEHQLIQILNTFKFDIVHIEGLYMLQYIDTIRSNTKAKIAYRPHNVENQIWDNLSQSSSRIFIKNYYKILAKRILTYELSLINQYDFIIPISEEDARFFRLSGNNKPEIVIPTGFEIETKPEIKFNPLMASLFFIGSLEWRPNQEAIQWFLKFCWIQLHQRFPELKWFIAGRNAPDKLKRQFSLPGIVWLGEIENARQFIADKSIMIVPLHSGSGMRIKIIEAFLNGKPVVSTTLGARGTKTTDGENILLADLPNTFVEKISKLIEQPQFYLDIASSSYEFTKNAFNNNNISNNLMGFYEKHLNN